MMAASLPVPLRPGRPLVGELLELWRDPLSVMLDGMRSGQAVTGFRLGPYRYYLINDPEGVEHVLLKRAGNYRKAPTYNALRLVLGRGLLTSEGPLWRRQRRLIQPAFHHRALRRVADTIVEAVDDLLDEWAERSPDSSNGAQASRPSKGARFVDLHREMSTLTFRIVGRALFSSDLRRCA